MTGTEFEIIALKAGGAVLGLTVFYLIRKFLLGRMR